MEPLLRDVIHRSLILTYEEQVDQLADALSKENLKPQVLVASYTPEELAYSRNIRTFVTHRSAWKIATEAEGYTLICESDFVPCRRMGSFPVFWPMEDEFAFGYLYQGSPRVLALIGDPPYLRGHTAPLVAYVINSKVAKILLDFFEYELSRFDPRKYFAFDAHLQKFAMGKGARAFIPLYHYGEHGGFPNPEHKQKGLPRAGVHRADNLQGPLYFLPPYACGSRMRFRFERFKAHMLGWARLFFGRWIMVTSAYDIPPVTRLKMYGIGVRRLLSL